MKTIYFIRHAKSIHDGVTPDFERDLNTRGKDNAKMMGKRLKKMKIFPDAVYTSSAKRTLKTAFLICENGDFIFKNGVFVFGLEFPQYLSADKLVVILGNLVIARRYFFTI